MSLILARGGRVFVGVLCALLAGILLCAGMAKLVVPAHSARAVVDLVPPAGEHAVSMVRAVAAAEVLAALALSVPATQDLGAALGVLLGVMFAVAGLTATIRGVGRPCGCFGRATGRPLGLRNVGFGLALVALSVLAIRDTSGGWAEHDGLPMLGAAVVAVAAASWLHRDMIRDLCRPFAARGSRTRSAA